jgi:peroxiredoxin
VQLQEHLENFHNAGLGVVAMTYDAPAVLNEFRARAGIDYPLLADIEAESVKALGILNENYAPGDSAYGIPHPGIFVLDTDGIIRAKVFIEGYDTRLHADSVLELARQTLGIDGG